MVLLLNDDDVRKVLTMKDVMTAMEEVFRERGLGGTYELPRAGIYAPINKEKSSFFQMRCKAAAVPKLNIAAMRLSIGMTQPRGGKERIVVARKTDATLLYSTQTGHLVAVVQNEYLQK